MEPVAPSYQQPEWRDLALDPACCRSGSYSAITATMPLRYQLTLLRALIACRSNQTSELRPGRLRPNTEYPARRRQARPDVEFEWKARVPNTCKENQAGRVITV